MPGSAAGGSREAGLWKHNELAANENGSALRDLQFNQENDSAHALQQIWQEAAANGPFCRR